MQRRRDQRLQRTVRRLDGCLPSLGRRTRRVLILRAGLGPAAALSRARVASLLELRSKRVARLERRGVRLLRRLDRRTGCANATFTSASAGLTVSDVLGSDAAAGGRPGGESTTSGHTELAAVKTGGTNERGGDQGSGGVLGEATEKAPPVRIAPEPSGSDPTVFILLLLLAAAVAGAVRFTRPPVR